MNEEENNNDCKTDNEIEVTNKTSNKPNSHIIHRVKFIEIPTIMQNNDNKVERTHDDNELDIEFITRCFLITTFIIVVLTLICNIVNTKRNRKEEIKNEKIYVLKPEIKYDILISPELIKSLGYVKSDEI